MSRTRPLSPLLVTLAAAAACDMAMVEDVGPDAGIGERRQPIASVMGGLEWSIDAPWRMEPPYGPVPITFSVHDANLQKDAETALELGKFCGFSIAEVTPEHEPDAPLATFVIHTKGFVHFHEFESSGKWPASSGGPMYHELRRLWAGELPETPPITIPGLGVTTTVLDVGVSDEWSGTLLFTPEQSYTAGEDLYLQVVAVVSKTGTCGLLPAAAEDVLGVPGVGGGFEETSTTYRFANTLIVHFGQALPRFDGGWVYGDIHYHAQGTDNEGESGMSYRSVIQAMKAMGLDFAFASEHASDSIQTTDIDQAFVDALPDDIPYLPDWDWLHDIILDAVSGVGFPYPSAADAQRDMSHERFAYLRHWLNKTGGVNQQVLSSPGWRAPQIFLGGEVDVVPEISAAERTGKSFFYGNGKKYEWAKACTQVPSIFAELEEYTTFEVCTADELVEGVIEGGRYKLRDVQGLGEKHFARQHLIHMPTDPLRDDAFVSSETTIYGGGYHRLKDLLAFDYDAAAKGFMFLAHPVAAAGGSGYGRLGPDIVPYADVQLDTAFRNRHVLGLQLWNEDSRLQSDRSWTGFPMVTVNEWVFLTGLWDQFFTWRLKRQDSQLSALHHGAAAWDKLLLWGINPAKRAGISWLASNEPRRVFMAGGSDAHGDLNFRREGAITGWSAAVDTAIGKPRNLLYVGSSRPTSLTGVSWKTGTTIGQAQVVDAFRSGQFSGTDGPAVRIAIDRNGNNVIDATDTPMGGIVNLDLSSIPVIVEWKSTPEFGPVTSIDLYVGAHHSSFADGVVYAPLGHGTRAPTDPKGTTAKSYTFADASVSRIISDGYYLDPSEPSTAVSATHPRGKLFVNLAGSEMPAGMDGYAGRVKVTLDRNDYRLFTKSCTTETIIIEADPELGTKPKIITKETCTGSGAKVPERLYVRAFARTESLVPNVIGYPDGYPLQRFAFTNPIWLRPAIVIAGGGLTL